MMARSGPENLDKPLSGNSATNKAQYRAESRSRKWQKERDGNTQRASSLHAYDSVNEARKSIMQYLGWYNRSRPHPKLEKKTPNEAYVVMLPTVELAA